MASRHTHHSYRASNRKILAFATALASCVVLIGAAAISAVAAAATSTTPPFHECPSVGASPSCQILLIIEPDTSIRILGDTNVGDFDGADDTLVGVANDSNQYISAITVSGPGSDLAGFDEDGLCAYITCTWPAPYGYEGPGTSFTLDASNSDTAEIDFGTAGLGPGQHTYFSLEGSLTAAAITARNGGLGSYVAMGDSYSSGEMGATGSYGWNSNLPSDHCHRSPNAYGPLLDTAKGLGALRFVACSGAITDDLFEPNHSGNIDINTGRPEAAQLDALSASTKIVTLTIGGNDAGFSDVVAKCVFARVATVKVYGKSGCSKDATITGPLYKRLQALDYNIPGITSPTGRPVHSLVSVLQAIHSRAPSAHIYLASYPELFGAFKGECGLGTIYASNVPVLGNVSAAVKITSDDAAWLDLMADMLNQAVNDATALAIGEFHISVTAVNPNPFFAGHRLCDSGNSVINSVSGTYNYSSKQLQIDSGSFHPNIAGQDDYESAFIAAHIS